MLLFWTLLPIIFLIKIVQKKTRLDQCKTKYFYGYYYGELKNKHFYWEFIRIYLKIILIFINTFLNQNNQITINSILIVIGIYLILLKRVNPFISQNIQSSELQAYSLLIAKIYLNSINQDSYQTKITIEILLVLIDYIFYFICWYTILVYKSKQGSNLSSRLIRALFKIFVTKIYYQKQIINSKTSLKTFKRWKLIQKNIVKIISLRVAQNINLITSRSNQLNSQQTEYQQQIITEQQKLKKCNQNSPFVLQNQSSFRQKQFLSLKKAKNWNTDEGMFNIMSDFGLKSDQILDEQDPSKVQKYCFTPKSLISNTKQSNIIHDEQNICIDE
ncbi:transmembrane protein, putative (macronuclear) [Tetrahymena thermophila SB210]|uniref:Transmembrane protein, putative n=1 Tax=Tetrahymena thermophila (strain SB210) TaxID=312017 RepID=Q246A8_TETTS|nr:transmembrane protein, putative [Tetrahymena thermophila SB210]EAS03475.2 transmembrane protein, putative [Tetrahymena thermophila SB210]|eukprot:XP_001023720.2 transmembrane protein, putative [Tetrahymena thermophila SB210]